MSSLQNRFRGKPITYTLQMTDTTCYIVIVAVNSFDETTANSLDSIAPSFIHRLSSLHIRYNRDFLGMVPLMISGVSSAKQTSVLSLNV